MEPASGPEALEARVSRLGRMSAAAVAIEAPKSGVLNVFIGLVVVVLGLSAVLLGLSRSWRGRTVSRLARGLQALLLLTLSVPLASWLMFLVTPSPATPGVAVASLGGTAVVVWLASLLVWWRFPSACPWRG